jgi:glycerophosphoryl diester phosphodiesterase
MKLIAHRGLIDGPNEVLENRPEHIRRAIKLGYDCEIDLWATDSKLYLGHDTADYPISEGFLKQGGLWIHCKNVEAVEYCLDDIKLNYFWHDKDDRTITSKGYIWTYPEKALTKWSIRLLPEWHDPEFKTILETTCYGICSDYVGRIKDIIATGQN